MAPTQPVNARVLRPIRSSAENRRALRTSAGCQNRSRITPTIMGTELSIEIWVCASLLAYTSLLILAAVWDIAFYRIPNMVVISMCVLFFVAALAVSFQPEMWGWHGLGFAIALGVGILSWRVGIMGGGDVKLIAALGLWTGINGLPGLFLVIALTGGIFTVFLILVRHCVQLYVSPARRPAILRHGEPVPYGVAIASAGLLIVPYIPLFSSAIGRIVE